MTCSKHVHDYGHSTGLSGVEPCIIFDHSARHELIISCMKLKQREEEEAGVQHSHCYTSQLSPTPSSATSIMSNTLHMYAHQPTACEKCPGDIILCNLVTAAGSCIKFKAIVQFR